MRGIEPYRKLRRIYKLGSKVEKVGQELVKPFYGNYELILVCVIKWWWVKRAQEILRIWGKRKWKFSLISRAYHLITYFNIKISWVTNNARFWHVFPDFIVSIEDYTLSKVSSLNLASVQNFQNFSTKYPLESFLMYYFLCLGFLKRLLMPWHLRRHLGTETYGRLPWQFCNFTCEIIN